MTFTLQDPMLTPAAAPTQEAPITEAGANAATTAAVATHDPVSLSLVTSQNNRLIEKAINGTVCRRGLSANQTIPNNAVTEINLDTTTFDTAEMASGTGIVIATPGVYSVSGFVSWVANAAGDRMTGLVLNGGVDTHAIAMAAPNHQSQVFVGDSLELDEGDTLNLFGLQVSGGDLAAVADRCWLSVHLIAPT